MNEANEANENVPAWADLFDRAATYGIDESAVREALARRREGTDADD